MNEKTRNDGLYKFVGEKICSLRKFKKFSQQYLADACHLERTSIINIERGRQRVPLDRLYDIAHTLGVEITEILPKQNEIGRFDQSTVSRLSSPDKLNEIKDMVMESQTKYGDD